MAFADELLANLQFNAIKDWHLKADAETQVELTMGYNCLNPLSSIENSHMQSWFVQLLCEHCGDFADSSVEVKY